jgi:hypothetical protein
MKVAHRVSGCFNRGVCCIALLTVICLTLLSVTSFGTEAVKKSETGKPFLSKHKTHAELTCDDCHLNKPPKQLTTEQCFSCHGSFEEVAETTKDSDPDPHNSPHYGSTLDCDLCHHEHSVSENFCTQCHDWELKVP